MTQSLQILPLRFQLRSNGIRFPGFSGSIWHGGIGQMLAQVSPQAFITLYQTEPESRLYSILPIHAVELPDGVLFELQITLFGKGVDYALAIAQAVNQLGVVGLRPGGRYELEAASYLSSSAEELFFSKEQGFIALPQAMEAANWLGVEAAEVGRCEVRLITPLRIKEGNELLRTAPSYAQLMRRIFGRIDQLAHAAQSATPLPKEMRAEIYAEAEAVQIESANITPFSIERRSARSGQQMQFGGLIGRVIYRGEQRLTLPWLRLAALVQAGGKTAFGFGGLEIEILNPVEN